MIRSDGREMLRRRLQEDTADYFTDAQLNNLLNLGVQGLAQRIRQANAEAFKYVDTADIVAAQEFYEWPAGCLYEYTVEIKDSTGAYIRIRKENWDRSRPYRQSILTDGETVYSPFSDTHFALNPVPASNVSQGIRLTWCPTLSMSADSDLIPVKQDLHMAAVLFAQYLALGDLGQDRKDVLAELEPHLVALPTLYRRTGEAAPALTPDIDKGYPQNPSRLNSTDLRR